MSETIDVCPNCGDSSITRQSTKEYGRGAYRCTACADIFDEPASREPQGSTGHAKGLAKQLLDADAEEVSR